MGRREVTAATDTYYTHKAKREHSGIIEGRISYANRWHLFLKESNKE